MIKDNWYICPVCGSKVFRVNEDTEIKNLPAWCKKCKNEILVTLRARAKEPEPID